MILLDLNVRLDVQSDQANNYWHRKSHVFDFIKSNDPDLIALQEFLPAMLTDLKDHFEKHYDVYAIPRDAWGESIPILIKKEVFEVLEKKTLWLSDTPEVSSKIEGSAFPRVMSYVVLKDIKHNKKLIFVNTHLDYQSEEVIYQQAVVLDSIIKKQIEKHHAEVILTGDFNQFPHTKAIQFLSARYQNIYDKTSIITNTFHGFEMGVGGKPIDYVFTTENIKINHFNIYQKLYNQIPLSDHYPLILDFDY
jgi:endonuclease/exonuclease/phosphatase family metal-dependent hydrolase